MGSVHKNGVRAAYLRCFRSVADTFQRSSRLDHRVLAAGGGGPRNRSGGQLVKNVLTILAAGDHLIKPALDLYPGPSRHRTEFYTGNVRFSKKSSAVKQARPRSFCSPFLLLGPVPSAAQLTRLHIGIAVLVRHNNDYSSRQKNEISQCC